MTDIVRIGFVGLGAMGTPMARRLVDAGYAVNGFDVSADARAHAEGLGVPVVESLGEAARDADVVILMLPDSNVVQLVVDELLVDAFSSEEVVIVDMSSSEPIRTRALATRLSDAGVSLIDAPVSGGVRGAQNGTLTIMVGGAPEVIGSCRVVLSRLGKVVATGPIGSGHATKALNNLMSATHLLVTSEVMLIGRAFGIDAETLLDVFNSSSGRSGSTENKWPNFIMSESYDSGFGLGLMVKDMAIAVDLARQSNVDCALGVDALGLWQRAAARLGPRADHTEIVRWLEEGGENA